MATTYLPNRNIGYPALNDSGWAVTADASFVNIDAAFGGNQTFALGAASGTVTVSATSYNGNYPANVASYVPLSWTLTGTLTANVTLQIPTGVGGQWIVNNQCTMASHTITISAAGGSTSSVLTTGIQTIYSDGLGHIRTAVSALSSALSISAGLVVSFPFGATAAADWNYNRVINSGFDVCQLGTSGAFGAAITAYTADQWLINNNTGSTANWSVVASDAGFSSPNCLYCSVNSVAATRTISFSQKFEGQRLSDLAGQSVAFSFDITANTSAGSLTGTVQVATNTALDNGTFSNFIYTPSFAIPGGVGRISVIVPSANTSTLLNGAIFSVVLTQAGSTGNVNAKVGGWVIEKGVTSNPWAAKSLGVEWSDCRRFLASSWPNLATTGFGQFFTLAANVASSSFAAYTVSLSTKMRTTPFITLYDSTGASGKVTVGGVDGKSAAAGGISSVLFNSITNNSGATWSSGSNVNFGWLADARL